MKRRLKRISGTNSNDHLGVCSVNYYVFECMSQYNYVVDVFFRVIKKMSRPEYDMEGFQK